ncbi:ADP-ribose pyrophosphatase [Micromonospora pallida]|uniref:ADP-ribose pyrophosphatase n=1 Tax=Micromonospora pallida TaxID=145854 RepID=A0A1C6STL2_9ACTN|nr:NUDIX hydrolase [Micromonospora pallida]SCL32672.1 ADP-ribose pyrophosphatase [Micromonospora pallida]
MTSSWQEYAELRERMPEHFVNPPDAAVHILHDPAEVAAAERAKAEALRARGLPTEWSRVGVAYRDEYVTLVRDPVRFSDGSLGTYIRTMPGTDADGVVLLPVLDGSVVLVEHFRHAVRSWQLEAPRGFGEAGVPALEQAARELREELGAVPTRVVDLGLLHPDAGTATDQVHLYLVEIAEIGRLDAVEGIRTARTYPAEKVGELIRDGVVTDSYTIAVWTRAWLRGLLATCPA